MAVPGTMKRVAVAVALATAGCVAEAQSGDASGHAAAPGALESRPASGEASPLQARIDAAAPGDLVEVEAGVHEGDLFLDRPVRLIGRGRPTLLGSGRGSVVHVRADDVTIEGFDLDGRGGGNLGRDSSGIHVSGRRAHVSGCKVERALFGIYLREADGAVLEGNTILGIAGKDAGEKGSGIHVWNTKGFRIVGNTIVDARDGLYIQSSSDGTIARNAVRDVRYGIHYMFSDDNTFEDNVFEDGAAGAALMYSNRIVFRRNTFLRNRGFASVGLLFKACDDVVAEDNLIADNARGLFFEGSYRNVVRRNVIAGSDVAVVLYDSCGGNRFEDNTFVGNMTPLTLVGKRTDTVFSGNFWSDNEEPDLDGDGRSDRPHRLGSVFDHFRGNLTAADLMSDGPGAAAVAAAERTFPVLQAVTVFDTSPRVRPPDRDAVPAAPARSRRAGLAGLGASLGALVLGASALAAGRRRDRR